MKKNILLLILLLSHICFSDMLVLAENVDKIVVEVLMKDEVREDVIKLLEEVNISSRLVNRAVKVNIIDKNLIEQHQNVFKKIVEQIKENLKNSQIERI